MNKRNWNSIIVFEWINNVPSQMHLQFSTSIIPFIVCWCAICLHMYATMLHTAILYMEKYYFFHFPWGNIFKLASWLCWIWISFAKYDMRIQCISMYVLRTYFPLCIWRAHFTKFMLSFYADYVYSFLSESSFMDFI